MTNPTGKGRQKQLLTSLSDDLWDDLEYVANLLRISKSELVRKTCEEAFGRTLIQRIEDAKESRDNEV